MRNLWPLLLLVAVGCSKPSPLVGGWVDPKVIYPGDDVAPFPLSFFEDGTVSINGRAGSYSLPDGSHIKVNIQGTGQVWEYSIKGDVLTVDMGPYGNGRRFGILTKA